MTFDPGIAAYLSLGLAVGMSHALEADHVAAVASLATGSRSLRDTVRVGVVWGSGHALVLAVVAGALLALGSAVPARVASMLELGVGVMLVGLGADVLRRLIVERVHFHRHWHGTQAHLHAHGHQRGYRVHDPSRHAHSHPRPPTLRAFLVGMTHGMAGSAALVVLAAGSSPSPLAGLVYVALFAVGSIAGMAALSMVIALPMQRLARVMTWTRNTAHALVGLATFGVGTHVFIASAQALAG